MPKLMFCIPALLPSLRKRNTSPPEGFTGGERIAANLEADFRIAVASVSVKHRARGERAISSDFGGTTIPS